MREIDMMYRTMFAELGQRTMDAQFVRDFEMEGVDGGLSVDGSFFKMTVKDREYWYHKAASADPNGRKQTYVGPVADPVLTSRVEEFGRIKDDIRARRKLVSTLVREAGLPQPERFTGDVVEALAIGGLFRLRGVLVGTVVFQCYPGILGVRLPASTMMTGDADFAQFHSISAAVQDSVPPMMDVLRGVDDSFREIPSQMDSRLSTQFENQSRYKVEFLTPNTGSADHEGKPAAMPALGGASAQPLRFLDFLIHEPVRSVMLHKGGVPVIVPSPQRYAVHKLIVASRRRDNDNGVLKRDKDAMQASLLMSALIETRKQADLAEVYAEAWRRGPAWREGITRGMSLVPRKELDIIRAGIRKGLVELGERPDAFGLTEIASDPTP